MYMCICVCIYTCIYIYIYICIYTYIYVAVGRAGAADRPRARRIAGPRPWDRMFAIGFLLEIPMRGFPFHTTSFDN